MEINYANQIGIKQLAAVALLVICLTQLPARGGQSGVQTELLSYAMGIVPGQKMRITAVNQQRQDGTAAGSEPLIWRVSATDADGNQVFQSNEIVSPADGFRHIDVETDDLTMAGDTRTGRKQVLWKVILFVREPQIETSNVYAELIDSEGQTTFGHLIGFRHEHTRPE